MSVDTDKRGGLIISSVLFKNFKMNRFSAFSPKLALGAAAALAAISLSPGSAQAFVVTVGGTQYDVTLFPGDYIDNVSKFNTPTNGGVMPWFGSESIAREFALAVGTSLGYVEPTGDGASFWGPMFAWGPAPCFATGPCGARYLFANGGIQIIGAPADYLSKTAYAWAQATEVASAAPVPGPLPLFGAAAAFGFSRQLRKRIKLAPNALGSSRPRA